MGRDHTHYLEARKLVDRQQYAEALPIFEKLANAGDAHSQAFLGWMYYEGLGVGRNRETAITWFERAAKLGSKEAAFYCGKIALGTRQYDEAAKWFHISAQAAFGPALLWLGVMHARGLGRPTDLAKALTYLEQAKKAGNFLARREIALLMVHGKLGIARIPLGLVLLLNSILSGIVSAILGNRSDELMG
jgi:TPR repeat protein